MPQYPYPLHPKLHLPLELSEVICDAAVAMARQMSKAFRIEASRTRSGATLRPGKNTPLWNELRAQLRPHLAKYGRQANLGRLLGLPRQRINAFVTGGGEMPDAERTLQLLAWLMAANEGRLPAWGLKRSQVADVEVTAARPRQSDEM
jgi:hypothetical protein